VVEGEDLDKARKIELIVKVDGREIVHVQAREPGMLAFVSKPADQGFEVDMVEATGRRYFDSILPEKVDDTLAPWQLEALGFTPKPNE
jgi:hypothetical protein